MLFPQASQVLVLIRYFVFSPLHFSKFIGKKETVSKIIAEVKEADLSFSSHSVEGSSADAAFNTAISILQWSMGAM